MTDKELFENNGYLIFDTKIDESLLNSVKDTVINPNEDRVQDAWQENSYVKEIALHTNIINKIYEVYDNKPLPFQTLNFMKGTQQKAHSDTIHFNSSPANNMCGVWVALEDIDNDNGPLFYYPGSHKDATYSMQDFNLEPISENYKEYEKRLSEQIIKKGYVKRYGTFKKGYGIIWAANLLHGGEPVKDNRRTRYSQVTHYFFESDLYYTPMLSSVNNLCIRKPNWIL
tara:strand:+ start:3132 stop:3815 length:684 start_codon:yes stop_codon:yes gene_type:complete